MSAPVTIVVMAKAPRPGAAKTRLEPVLGADGVAALQAALIRHTVRVVAQVAPTVVAFAPAAAEAELRRLTGGAVALFPQPEGDLGTRMAAVVAEVHQSLGGGVVVIATDVPTLPVDVLRDAVHLVGGGRTVLGPAVDGGYYLIGLPRPHPWAFAIDPHLWGGHGVLAATLASLRTGGVVPHLLPTLRDLDTPDDAAALLGDPRMPESVAQVLVGCRRAAATHSDDHAAPGVQRGDNRHLRGNTSV